MNIFIKTAVTVGIGLILVACGDKNPELTTTLVVENATPDQVEDNRLLEPVMLNYLKSIQGISTVVGVHNREPNNEPDKWTIEAAKVAGVWPGLWSGDFLFSQDDIASRWDMIFEAEKRWKQGMLVNLMLHVCPPTTSETCGWNESLNGMHYELTDQEWTELLTDGTDLNNTWKERLDDYAFYLDYLNKKGVRVMFRPFHEMNQTLFWWSSKSDGKENLTAKLYQLTHDYMTNEKDLTNLTWVWNVQDFDTLEQDLEAYDPGENYWDVLTLDMYGTDGKGFTDEKYQALLSKANGKPIGLGEVSKLPTAQLLLEQPEWTFVMSWAELTFQDNSNNAIHALYNADNVVKLDDMPGWTAGNKVMHELPEPDQTNGGSVEPLVIFTDEITSWSLPDKTTVIEEEVVVDEDPAYGNVIQHTYNGIEVVSEFSSDSAMDLSTYAGGTIEFDLFIVNEPVEIDGKWFMKMDCGWPCGTGDVALSASVEGVSAVIGEWQHFTFNLDDLVAIPNNGTPLSLASVISPLVLFPKWGPNQKDTVFRVDNIIVTASDEPILTNLVVFDEEITNWQLPESNTLIREEVISDEDPHHGNVIKHTYNGIETVSEFRSEDTTDLTRFAEGTLEFDLYIVNEPEGIDGQWFIKMDCGWPCGTGDIAITESIEGTAPTVGQWQHYTFSIQALAALENNGTPLDLAAVSSPLVLFPKWGSNQRGTIFKIDNISVNEAAASTVDEFVIFKEQIGEWSLPEKTTTITEEVVTDEDITHGNVIQHTYNGIEVVSEFYSETAINLTDYIGGTVEFDLYVVNEPEGIFGNWFMKVDCGWPCGTGDVPLNSSVEGIMPSIGEWQHFTFNVDDLIALPNDGNALDITKVISPLVLFPQWGSSQKDTIFRIDNIIYAKNKE